MAEAPDLREQECSSASACDGLCDQHYRPRVSFTSGSIQGVVMARKRHVCGNHLSGVQRHYIEPGDRYVANALPPDHPDIGNPGWWHLRVCLDCCPVEHDPRVSSSPGATS